MMWLFCLFGTHAWEKYPHRRLMRLDDSWPPIMADGLPSGQRFDCRRCGAMTVKAYSS